MGSTYPEIPHKDWLSGFFKWRWGSQNQFGLGHLQRLTEEAKVRGAFAGSVIRFPSTVDRFEKAWKIWWKGSFFQNRHRPFWLNRLSYIIDPDDEESWLQFRTALTIGIGGEVFTQCDFFGSPHRQLGSSDVIARYQNNDRCLVGGEYVF